MITLGTGIGGGAIIDGHLPTGHSQGFAEVGHMILEPEGEFCECGSRGCWETLAARNAIIRRAQGKIQQGRRTRIAERVHYRLGSLTPALISHCAEEGDEVAIEVMAEVGYYLGLGVTNLIQLYNPELFIVGGGDRAGGEESVGPDAADGAGAGAHGAAEHGAGRAGAVGGGGRHRRGGGAGGAGGG